MLSRLLRWLVGIRSRAALPSRRERRLEAKQHHHQTGAPLWTSADRHLNPGRTEQVADITPGTPGHFGSVRSAGDKRSKR
jgi:hypothetical protein